MYDAYRRRASLRAALTPVNVAWIVGFPVFGGPHNHVLRIARPLLDHDVRVTAVVPEDSSSGKRLRDAGLSVIDTPIHRVRATRDWRPHYELARYLRSDLSSLRMRLREADIDVVVQATLLPPHGALAGMLEDLPIVWQIVDTRVPPAARVPAMSLLRATADAAMFCGEAVRELHMGHRKLPCTVEVFYPPVDTDRFKPSPALRAVVRNEEKLPSDSRVVGMVANINPMKGWEYFIRAAGILYTERQDLYFLMVGSVYEEHRGYLAMLEREMAASGVPRERFRMTGERSDVERLLVAIDVQLITSVRRSEGAPTSGLEGMACGVPLVGVDVAAVAEFVEHGVTGFVVPPLDPHAIASAAARALDDARLRKRLGDKARTRAVSQYRDRHSAEQHARVFNRAIQHHDASRLQRPARTLAVVRRWTRPGQ